MSCQNRCPSTGFVTATLNSNNNNVVPLDFASAGCTFQFGPTSTVQNMMSKSAENRFNFVHTFQAYADFPSVIPVNVFVTLLNGVVTAFRVEPDLFGSFIPTQVSVGKTSDSSLQVDFYAELLTSTPNTRYNIEYVVNSTSVVTLSSYICNSKNLVISLPPKPPGNTSIPNIFGRVYLTQDQENISLAQFLVLTEGKNDLYKQYCVALQDVLRTGSSLPDCAECPPEEKCLTLAEKVQSLIDAGWNIDLDSVVSYSMLRYVLSFLLFGKWDLNYLRRKYYKQFLEKLECSIWKEFLPNFTEGDFNYYWKLFKK